MLIFIVSVFAAIAITAYLSTAKFTHTKTWLATVTPLASIIGSGFLICGPVLAREFGGAAALAMMGLLALAYAVGAVVRFNIMHAEPYLRTTSLSDALGRWKWAAQLTLAVAYAISVAYYLKLLAEFVLHYIPLPESVHALVSKVAVSGIIACFALLSVFGAGNRLERLAHATVSLKIGVIGGILTALALYWVFRWNVPVVIPAARISPASIALLLGLLVTVQGFETSRYLGETYEPAERAQTMRYAQWLSSAIYIGFLLLLTPFLGQATRSEGVAGILEVLGLVAPLLGALVLIGAASSQLSAAVADTIGAGGLAAEVSGGRLNARAGTVAASGLAVLVVWLTDPLQVIAIASRAFALYYALQCVIAFIVSRRSHEGGPMAQPALVAAGVVCLAAAIAGAPAE